MSASALAEIPALDLNVAATDGSLRTQAGRDWYQAQRRIDAELQAEHLLAKLHASTEAAIGDRGEAQAPTGGVQPLTSAEWEQIVAVLTDPRVHDLLSTSAYYAGIVEGKTTN